MNSPLNRNKWEPYLWLLPSILLIAVFVVFPIIIVFKLSFSEISKAGVIGGYIGFQNYKDAFTAVINQVLAAGDDYGKNRSGAGKKVLVEWVSANPTGDLHCGHARNAAWGDSICRLMEASGWEVLREYYVNDAGNQIVMLGKSLEARYFEHFGRDDCPLPENGYHAEDVKQIAEQIAELDGDKWLNADPQ